MVGMIERETEEDLDKVFLYVAHKVGGIRPLLRSFFGFLQRQTDFYNAPTEAAQHMVQMAFQEFNEVHKEKGASKSGPMPQAEPGCIEEITGGSCTPTDCGNRESEDLRDNELEVAEFKEDSAVVQHEGFYEESKRTKKGSVYPNEGDGATYKHYKWTQTPTELEVLVPLCEHRQKFKSTLQVNYTSSSLFAYIQNKKMFGGCLADQIKPDEVTWTLEDNILYVRAEKMKASWWKQLLITEPMLLLKPILRKHSSINDIGEEEMRQFKQTVVNKRDYTIAKHKEQFPDKIPIPEHLK